jgi:four helix bundle protein
MKSYKYLIVWQKSIALVKEVNILTDTFPSREEYSLISQIRKSAISIPSNIAEGYGRNSARDYIRFLKIARGSLYELQTQIDIAAMIEYCENKRISAITQVCDEISKRLTRLISKIKEC